jgi:integration host factor subunit beta
VVLDSAIAKSINRNGLGRLSEDGTRVAESSVLTKKDIVRTISEEIGLTQQQTKKIVQKTFDAIIDSLVREGRIELRNFGVFEVKQRAARKARNPRTGRQVSVPEKFVVTFKPGKEMEAKVMELIEQDSASLLNPLAMTDSIKNNSASLPHRVTPGRSDTAN